VKGDAAVAGRCDEGVETAVGFQRSASGRAVAGDSGFAVLGTRIHGMNRIG
jgi:hypothetical protein